MDNTVFCLRNLNPSDHLAPIDLLREAPNMRDESYKTGDYIYHSGAAVPFVYVIISGGEVELLREEADGKTVVIETLLPGDLFGDFGLGVPLNHAARVSKSVKVCKTPTSDFLNLVRQYPDIVFQLMRVMAQRTHDYENKIAQLSRPAKEQLLAELQLLQRKHQTSLTGRLFKVPLRISHQRLAEKTGLNRVTVTKLMGELRATGAIEVDDETGVIRVK